MKRFLFGGPGGGSPLADLGLMLLRGFAGFAMLYLHGWDKLQNPAKGAFLAKAVGFPDAVAPAFGWGAILAESLGGLLLAVGLATRPAAVMVASTMFTAAFIFHRNDPFAKRELALLYLFVALLFVLTGSGRYGLDALFHRRGKRRGSAAD